MAHSYTKITSADTQNKGVLGLADTPNLSTGDMQAKFDELSTDVIIPKFNNLCDELNANVGNAVQSKDITNMRISKDNTIQISTDDGESYEDTASSGHIIMNGSGISYKQRTKMQFSSNVVISDDTVNERTFISIPPGEKGDKGNTATITIGTVQSGDEAKVTNSGSSTDAILNFTFPKGNPGDAATIQVGTVTSGSSASVSNRGTSSNAIFDFMLPKGEKGDVGQGINVLGEYSSLLALQTAHPTGNPGNCYMVGTENPKDLYIWNSDTSSWKNQGALQGVKGDKGNAGTISVGTVTEGSSISVENVGTSEEAILNFTLKKGDKGEKGDTGTISVGTVLSGDTPSVVNSGTSTSAIFDFVLPKGERGSQGEPTIVNGKSGSSVTVYGSDIVIDGYSKPSVSGSLVNTDTINEALGKLEARDDNHDFTITTTWLENTSIGDYTNYPYYQTISTDIFTDESHPDCLVFGVDTSVFMTSDEDTAKGQMCGEVSFSASGIILLAMSATETPLTLRVRGV